jgi:beta-glucosidase
MCAYNRINGEPACSSKFLLGDTLRGAWKFNGYVVSDCGAISDISNKPGVGHHVVNSLPEAAALSLKTGTDSDCAMSPDVPSYLEAMQKGLISQREVDINLKRLFKARFQLGMFDPPEMVPYAKISPAEVDTPAHRDLALTISRQSMVLLKNDGILPLNPGVRTIAIVGPLADHETMLRANYNGADPFHDYSRWHPQTVPGSYSHYTPGTRFLRNAVMIPQTALQIAGGRPGVDAVYFNNSPLPASPLLPVPSRRSVPPRWASESAADALSRRHRLRCRLKW